MLLCFLSMNSQVLFKSSTLLSLCILKLIQGDYRNCFVLINRELSILLLLFCKEIGKNGTTPEYIVLWGRRFILIPDRPKA